MERLQKLATTNVSKEVKTMWLRWWNNTPAFRRSVRFPDPFEIKDRVLEGWLARAALWSQVLRLYSIIILTHLFFSNLSLTLLTSIADHS